MNKLQTVYVLGGTGMLGFEVAKQLSQNKNIRLYVSVRSSAHKRHLQKTLPGSVSFFIFDAEKNIKKLGGFIKNKSVIVNCIGIIKPHINETDRKSVERAIKVNSILPYQLAEIAIKKSVRIIQIATDCVYSGTVGNYKESNPHDALDVYGKTKSLGEVTAANFNNIRVSIIGREIFRKLSLLEWFLGQKKSAELSGFTNHFWNGIPTYHFAKIIEKVITQNLRLPSTIHLTPKDTVSKYELLVLFKKYFRPDITIKKTKAQNAVNRILATEFATINNKLWKACGYKKIPTISELIKEASLHT